MNRSKVCIFGTLELCSSPVTDSSGFLAEQMGYLVNFASKEPRAIQYAVGEPVPHVIMKDLSP